MSGRLHVFVGINAAKITILAVTLSVEKCDLDHKYEEVSRNLVIYQQVMNSAASLSGWGCMIKYHIITKRLFVR